MSIVLMKLNQLLDIQQVEQLLKAVIKFTPQALWVVDLEDNVLAKAGPADIPADINDLYHTVQADAAAIEIVDKPYTAVRVPIDIHGQQLGYVIGVSADSDHQVAERVTATVQMVSQILADQTYKEYELNSLSTELVGRYEELTLLYELSQDLGAVFDIPTICDIALDRAMQIVSVEKAFIALMDEDSKHLTVMATRGIQGFVGWKVPVDHGISGRVAALGKQVLLHAREPSSPDPKRKKDTLEAVLSIPLILPTDQSKGQHEVLGVITLAGKPPGEDFSAGEAKLLTTIMIQVTVAIHNSRLIQALREAERVQQQIEIAARIQQSLLPKHPPQLPAVELAGECISAANVGGDYYDFVTDEAGRLTLLIADVSGHSVGSALMMVMARSILRHEIALGKPIATVLADTNTAMLNDLIQAEMFISVFCARYDPATHQLTFANGGHNPPLLWRKKTGQIIPLNSDGLIVGVLENVVYEERAITLHPGDALILYTDGVIEARNPDGEQFGQDRVQELLTEYGSLSSDVLAKRLYKAIRRHIQDTIQQDDMTFLILKVQEQA